MYAMQDDVTTQESPIIRSFSLPGLLDQGHILTFHRDLGVLSYLLTWNGSPMLIAQQHFTRAESMLLLHLLEAYPSYCSYETLLAGLAQLDQGYTAPHTPIVSEQQWMLFIKPLRHTLSRTRLKARVCGLDIAAIHEVGYLLHANSDHSLFSREVSLPYIHRTTTTTKGVASYAH
jgi:hypothetical protein